MKKIAFRDNIIAKEKTPYPVVLYPGFYGTFLGFKIKIEDSQIYFCSCSNEAIENYIKHKLKIPGFGHTVNDPNRFFLNYGKFPKSFIKQIKDKPQNEDIIEYFHFENKICHECNKNIPSYRYCHEMYGSVFKQNYGWYINKQANEWGIVENEIDFKLCPDEIIDLLEITPKEYFKLFHELLSEKKVNEFHELLKKFNNQKRKIWNVIESEVRVKFGHKKVGESWISETILYYIVKKLYPGKKIFRHFRPPFLKGMELDIFIEDFNLGIEYQGIQHYKPVKHWGGETALKKVKERDKKKKNICKSQNVTLIYFEYNEELSEKYVLNRIKNNIK